MKVSFYLFNSILLNLFSNFYQFLALPDISNELIEELNDDFAFHIAKLKDEYGTRIENEISEIKNKYN